MGRRNIKVRAVERRELDVRLYVVALIEFARQLQADAEAARQAADDREAANG
jgi:hypothetical protein